MAVNPYVFIVGCPRSGTTLLKRIVDAHPAVAITPETHWIPWRARAGRGIAANGLVTAELCNVLFDYFRFPRLGITRDELTAIVASGVSYPEFVSAIFDLYGAKRGKRVVGDKTPPYVREIQLLHSWWPTARFVHIIRDGRDVALSAVNWKSQAERFARRFSTWRDEPIVTAALWWRRMVTLGREDGAALGPDLYLELRYEDLVDEPERESRRLCEFLDVPYDDAMLDFHAGRTKSDPGLTSKQAWLPVTAGLRDWRTQMDAPDVARFEGAAGNLLAELGYERAARGVPADVAAEVARVARLCEEDLPFRGAIPVGAA